MSKVNGEIGDWDGTEVDHTESGILHKYIDVSKLTFEKSNVYKVIHSGKQVAEICKEYLVTPDFSSQAIVAYPMKEDGSVNISSADTNVISNSLCFPLSNCKVDGNKLVYSLPAASNVMY